MNVYDLKNINASNLKPRQAQKDLLKFAQDCVLSNKKHILIDAPTGIGKSF
jgi:Rad3-related DNA helicase